MARARIYFASEAARKQLEALEAYYAAESAWRKAEAEVAMKRWAAIGGRRTLSPWRPRMAR
jgi:hypothetical protein